MYIYIVFLLYINKRISLLVGKSLQYNALLLRRNAARIDHMEEKIKETEIFLSTDIEYFASIYICPETVNK